MAKNPDAPTRIVGKIISVDGAEVEFQIVADVGWMQWGAANEILGRNSEMLEALTEVAREHLQDEIDDAEPDVCSECGNEIDPDNPGDYGMCAGCLHDALRSGWEPGKDDR